MPAGSSIPPPFSGYWAWVRDELKTKAGEKWVMSELSSLKRMFDDTQMTARDTKKIAEKPYVCTQKREIEKLKTWQDKVTNWRIPVILSIVVLILSAAGQYFSLKDGVEDGNEDRTAMQKTLEKIQDQQIETSRIIEDLKWQSEKNEESRDREMQLLFKKTTAKPKSESKPKVFRTKTVRTKTTKASNE